ncbi:hypothetical protein ACYUFO_003496 [Vibrio parahaemolyticus]
MKPCELPELTIDSIERITTTPSGCEITLDIELSLPSDYVRAFKDMAKKISDDTLIKMLHERDPEYISEGYQL